MKVSIGLATWIAIIVGGIIVGRLLGHGLGMAAAAGSDAPAPPVTATVPVTNSQVDTPWGYGCVNGTVYNAATQFCDAPAVPAAVDQRLTRVDYDPFDQPAQPTGSAVAYYTTPLPPLPELESMRRVRVENEARIQARALAEELRRP